ncbi:hypothetical protein QBD00_004320 [Ochrobactrum sp. AN78]|nr:hypothetical protein [Ochrobactrum sp. AN78]
MLQRKACGLPVPTGFGKKSDFDAAMGGSNLPAVVPGLVQRPVASTFG